MTPSIIAATPSCTSPCWNAKQKTCQCSCHGLNHGTLRPINPSAPPNPEDNPGIPFQLTVFLHDRFASPPDTPLATLTRRRRPTNPEKQDQPSMSRYLVTVTHDHLHQGVTCDMRACSLALAIASCSSPAGPLFTNVSVALKATSVNNSLLLHTSPVQTWISRHDDPSSPKPSPATFVIDLQTSTISLREETTS